MWDGGEPSKRRKISDLRNAAPYCSQSALSLICKEIEKHGLPDQKRRQDIWKENKDLLESTEMCKYGPLLQTMAAQVLPEKQSISGALETGSHLEIFYVNILSFLAGVFHKCGSFTDWLLKFHSLKPSSATQPWKAVVYVDEVHPGNILNSSGRKAWCCYMLFLELGSMLSKEDLWMCLFVVRSSEVQLLEAGISQVVRLLLERLFVHDQPQTGVLLSSAKGNVRLFLHWECFCKMELLRRLFGQTAKTVVQSLACCARTFFI